MTSRTMIDHEASRNRIDWLASLDTEAKAGKTFRRSSIICTIGRPPSFETSGDLNADRELNAGPKTNSPEKINMLRKGGTKPA